MATSEDQNSSAEFLLTEYNQITEETRRLRGEGLSRLNFFITITSTALAGLVVLGQSSTASDTTVQLVSVGALIFLTLLGWNAFRFIISRDISTDFNIRANGRIHRYFIERDPSISKYITWQDHDEPTSWIANNTSNLRSTSQSILSSLCALNAGIIANLIFTNLYWSIAIGIIFFLITLMVLNRYAKMRFKAAKEKAQKSIRFPKLAHIDDASSVPSIMSSNVDIKHPISRQTSK